MTRDAYELASLTMRYVFAGLMLWIVARAARGLLVDVRRAAKLRRLSPMTGISGEMIVTEGDGHARRGVRYPVIREGLIGSARYADVRIRHASVRRRHAYFVLAPDGLHLRGHAGARLRDAAGRSVRETVLLDGDTVTIGGVSMLLVLSVPVEGRRRAPEELPDAYDAGLASENAGGEVRRALYREETGGEVRRAPYREETGEEVRRAPYREETGGEVRRALYREETGGEVRRALYREETGGRAHPASHRDDMPAGQRELFNVSSEYRTGGTSAGVRDPRHPTGQQSRPRPADPTVLRAPEGSERNTGSRRAEVRYEKNGADVYDHVTESNPDNVLADAYDRVPEGRGAARRSRRDSGDALFHEDDWNDRASGSDPVSPIFETERKAPVDDEWCAPRRKRPTSEDDELF